MPNKNLVALTGAGISTESGLSTFRDSGGLWEGYDINEVASIDGWYRNPTKVLEFYNLRRKQSAEAIPNTAHKVLVELEELFNVHVITQNVDDLHERAGSTNVTHLHGQLTKAQSERDENIVIDIGTSPIKIGDIAADGAQLRPAIVWFGEMVPMMEEASQIVSDADILLVIGTSLAVYPAANLVHYCRPETIKYIIDPSIPELHDFKGWEFYKEKATIGLPKVKQNIIEHYG